jgi:hypothetical protein
VVPVEQLPDEVAAGTLLESGRCRRRLFGSWRRRPRCLALGSQRFPVQQRPQAAFAVVFDAVTIPAAVPGRAPSSPAIKNLDRGEGTTERSVRNSKQSKHAKRQSEKKHNVSGLLESPTQSSPSTTATHPIERCFEDDILAVA